MEMIKSLGFNMVRAHLKPLTGEQLDWCDLHGLMVYEETPIAWMDEPAEDRAFQVAAREITEMITAHRNHPSIVTWGITNENGRFAGDLGLRLLRLAGQIDPSHPVIDVSGWAMNIFPEGGWVNETRVLRPGIPQPALLEDNHHYLRSPVGTAEWNLFRNLGDPAKMGSYEEAGYGPVGGEKKWYERLASSRDSILVSEFGCGGMCDLENGAAAFSGFRAAERGGPPSATGLQDETDLQTIWAGLAEGLKNRGLLREFGSVTGFVEACQFQQAEGVRRLAEALRLNPRVAGFILTQYNDVSWECSAGVVDPWRNPKRVAREIPRLTAPELLVIRPSSHSAESGTRVRMDFSVASDGPLPAGTIAEYRIHRNTESGRNWTPLKLKGGNASIEVGDLPARGKTVVEARLRSGKKRLSTATETVYAIDVSVGSQKSFALYGEAPAVKRAFSSWLIPAEFSQSAVVVKPASLPKAELGKALETARKGGKTVLLELEPADLTALAKFGDFPVKGGARKTVSTFVGWFHWFRKVRFMSGLPGVGADEPGRFLAGEALADILPVWSLPEPTGSATVFAGATGMNIRIMEPKGPPWHWCTDIMEVTYGKGKLVFCQYRLLKALDTNPAARTLFYRLLML